MYLKLLFNYVVQMWHLVYRTFSTASSTDIKMFNIFYSLLKVVFVASTND